MEVESGNARRVRFGAFEADLQARELRKSGIKVRLQDQPFRVLALLLSRSGEVVSREQLRQEIWPDDTFVDFDHSLNTAINKIREALGDSASHPRFVETVPRRGYRFVFPVARPSGGERASARAGLAASGDQADREVQNSRERIVWAIAAVAMIGLLAVGTVRFQEPLKETPEDARPITFPVYPPPGTAFAPWTSSGPPAFSPDGKHLVFVAEEQDDSTMLWVRALDSLESRPVPGTDGATYPFWSPDSRQVAFFANGKLKRVAISGANLRVLCDAPNGRGGAWSTGQPGGEEVILFSPDIPTGLYRVSPQGGEPQPVTKLATDEAAHRNPTFLPDGQHFFYVLLIHHRGAKGKEGIYLATIETQQSKDGRSPDKDRRLLEGFTKVAYVSPISEGSTGYILHVLDNTLIAQPFDASRLELTGNPSVVAESVMATWGRAIASFSASNTGNLALRTLSSLPLSRLVWFDRNGRPLAVTGEPDRYGWVELSPQEERIAFEIADHGLTKGDIWVLESATGRRTPITSHPAFDGGPIWAPDGKSLVFHSKRDGASYQIYRKAATGLGTAEQVSEKGGWVWDWYDKYILHSGTGHGTGLDLWITETDGDRVSRPYLEEKSFQNHAQFSPDGRYVAYTSNESGRNEVYVQPFPPNGQRWPISIHGGTHPRWRGDSEELFYVARDGMLMSVDIRRGPSFLPGAPKELFRTRIPPQNFDRRKYDVTADGERFLINTVDEEQAPQPVTVIVNWQAKLER